MELLSCGTGKGFRNFTDLNTVADHSTDESCTAGDDATDNITFRYKPEETLLECGRVYWGDDVFHSTRVQQRRFLLDSQVIPSFTLICRAAFQYK